jgi:hypothetical protein
MIAATIFHGLLAPELMTAEILGQFSITSSRLDNWAKNGKASSLRRRQISSLQIPKARPQGTVILLHESGRDTASVSGSDFWDINAEVDDEQAVQILTKAWNIGRAGGI